MWQPLVYVACHNFMKFRKITLQYNLASTNLQTEPYNINCTQQVSIQTVINSR